MVVGRFAFGSWSFLGGALLHYFYRFRCLFKELVGVVVLFSCCWCHAVFGGLGVSVRIGLVLYLLFHYVSWCLFSIVLFCDRSMAPLF